MTRKRALIGLSRGASVSFSHTSVQGFVNIRGTRKSVTVEALAAILATLGVSLREFFKPFREAVRPRTPRRRGRAHCYSFLVKRKFQIPPPWKPNPVT